MPDFISVSLDETLIDRSRLRKSTKAGSNAVYLELSLVPLKDGPNQWDNEWFVTQALTKEERERKVRAPIIGNARRPFNIGGNGKKDHQPKPAPAPARPSGGPSANHTNPNDKDEDNDVPF